MNTSLTAQIAAVERLIALINPDAETAATQQAAFHEALADSEEEVEDGDQLIWLLKDVIDWESGFFVDWKDTESFVGSVDKLCDLWNAEIYWGTDDPEDEEFLDSTDVPALMETAHRALAAQGLTLWNWATDGDCYGGWIARSSGDADMMAVSSTLEVEFRPSDQPF